MSLTGKIATFFGDIWVSRECLGIWPWPCTVLGMPKVKTNADDYRCFTRFLQPGDFLLTQSRHYKYSNKGIPGSFKHLAIYTGAISGYRDRENPEFILKARSLGINYEHTGEQKAGIFERTVTHAISEGVVVQDFYDLLHHCDYICAVRPWKTSAQAQEIVELALSRVGLEYNFDFKPEGPPASYCTEMGSFVCEKLNIECPVPVKIKASLSAMVLPLERFKTPVYLADTFLMYPMVCSSVSCSEAAFPKLSFLENVVREAVRKAPNAMEYVHA